jgi:TPR repeat protein
MSTSSPSLKRSKHSHLPDHHQHQQHDGMVADSKNDYRTAIDIDIRHQNDNDNEQHQQEEMMEKDTNPKEKENEKDGDVVTGLAESYLHDVLLSSSLITPLPLVLMPIIAQYCVSMSDIGNEYEMMDHNFTRSFYWYHLAAHWDHEAIAAEKASLCLLYGYNASRIDHDTAFTLLHRSASLSSRPLSMSLLAECYMRGYGTERNFEIASSLYDRIGNGKGGNDHDSLYGRVGWAIVLRQRHDARSATCWARSIAQLQQRISLNFSSDDNNDEKKRISSNSNSNSNSGSGKRYGAPDIHACSLLGELYLRNNRPSVAIRYYREAAHHGHALAQTVLACLLMKQHQTSTATLAAFGLAPPTPTTITGVGYDDQKAISIDDNEPLSLLHRASHQGFPQAIRMLAMGTLVAVPVGLGMATTRGSDDTTPAIAIVDGITGSTQSNTGSNSNSLALGGLAQARRSHHAAKRSKRRWQNVEHIDDHTLD